MMLKLTEVYRKIKFEGAQRVSWDTRDVYINSDNILMMSPDDRLKKLLSEGSVTSLPGGVKDFTILSLKENKEITVLGGVVEVQQVINGGKSILHG